MKIEKIQFRPWDDLVHALRNVNMLQDRTVRPYAGADIASTQISAEQLAPAQRYVLRREWEKVRALRWALMEHGVDILRMCETRIKNFAISNNPHWSVVDKDDKGASHPLGFVEFRLKNSEQWVTVLPPIIEVQTEADSSKHNIICDGMHRCFLARSSKIVPAIVRIEGASKPYYAFPLADGWRDVQLVERLTPNFIKKFHRVEQYKALYRDFDSAFQNVGGPRGDGTVLEHVTVAM